MKVWQKVSDTTGRGYGSSSKKGTPFAPGVSNETAKYGLPRPTMETITNQNAADLDIQNRFYQDNLHTLNRVKVERTSKQEAEQRLIIDRYEKAKEMQ